MCTRIRAVLAMRRGDFHARLMIASFHLDEKSIPMISSRDCDYTLANALCNIRDRPFPRN